MKALLKFWVWVIFAVVPARFVIGFVWEGVREYRLAQDNADVDISMMPLPCFKAPKDPTCVGPYKRGS